MILLVISALSLSSPDNTGIGIQVSEKTFQAII
jgi:hypothetical protein